MRRRGPGGRPAPARQRFGAAARRLHTEDSARRHASQRANSLAVLGGVVSGPEAAALMRRAAGDSTLSPCSIYFRYYLNRALAVAGLGDLHLERLGARKTMLDDGLTTWAERDGSYSRSDCHAWGASPNTEFSRTVPGVDSDGAGLFKVIIRPHLGLLKRVRGRVPHPKGIIPGE